MFNRLTGRYAVVRIVHQEFNYQVLHLWTHMSNKFWYSGSLWHMREVEFHVSGILLELVQQLFRWRPHDIVNFDYLIEFVVTREEREQR